MIRRKIEHSQSLRNVHFQPIGQGRSGICILQDRLPEVGFRLLSVRGLEDRPDVCGNLLAHFLLGYILAGVLLKVKLATLPGNPGEGRLASFAQSTVVVTDDQLHTLILRSTRLSRKVRQCKEASLRETETPKMHRFPSGPTPATIKMAASCIWPSMRTFS